jgi:hypothetical protein
MEAQWQTHLPLLACAYKVGSTVSELQASCRLEDLGAIMAVVGKRGKISQKNNKGLSHACCLLICHAWGWIVRVPLDEAEQKSGCRRGITLQLGLCCHDLALRQTRETRCNKATTVGQARRDFGLVLHFEMVLTGDNLA